MVEIEIHFTEYFTNETVVISSDGRELHRAEQLKTDLRTSLARIVRVAVPPGRPTLKFELSPHGSTASVALDPAKLRYITVTLADGKLKVDAVSEEDYRREPRGHA